jgi:hypothetical protein
MKCRIGFLTERIVGYRRWTPVRLTLITAYTKSTAVAFFFAALVAAIAILPAAARAQAPSDLVVVNNWNTETDTYTGRLEVFRIGSKGTVEHNWQSTPGGNWSGWNTTDFSGVQVKGIAVGQNADGRLELFVEDTNQVPRHSWQTSANSGWNGSLVELGFGVPGESNQIETPVVSQVFPLPVRSSGGGNGQSQDGRLEVFANWPSIQTSVLHAWQVPFGGTGGWLGWTDVEDNFGTLAAVAQNTDGRLEVFTGDGNGVAWHFLQQIPSDDSLWFPVQFLGNAPSLSQLVVAQNADGRLEAFGVTNHGSVYHLWQTEAGVGVDTDISWGEEWVPLASGFDISRITVGQNSDGDLEVFAVTNHGTPLHAWQTSPGGAWSGWNDLGGGNFTATELVVAQNLNGSLEVFNKTGGVVSHIWQEPSGPNGGWSNWTTLN